MPERYYQQLFESWIKETYNMLFKHEPIPDQIKWDNTGLVLVLNWSRWDHPFKHLLNKNKISDTLKCEEREFPQWTKR